MYMHMLIPTVHYTCTYPKATTFGGPAIPGCLYKVRWVWNEEETPPLWSIWVANFVEGRYCGWRNMNLQQTSIDRSPIKRRRQHLINSNSNSRPCYNKKTKTKTNSLPSSPASQFWRQLPRMGYTGDHQTLYHKGTERKETVTLWTVPWPSSPALNWQETREWCVVGPLTAQKLRGDG